MRVLALATTFLLASTVATAADPIGDDGLSCVYATAARNDMLANMSAAEGEAAAARAAATARVRAAADVCATKYGWSTDRYRAALVYASGRTSYEEAGRLLGGWGIDPLLIDKVVVRLSPAERDEVLAGNPQKVTEITLQIVATSGLDLARGTAAEWEKVGEAIGRGVAGAILRDLGSEGYGRR